MESMEVRGRDLQFATKPVPLLQLLSVQAELVLLKPANNRK